MERLLSLLFPPSLGALTFNPKDLAEGHTLDYLRRMERRGIHNNPSMAAVTDAIVVNHEGKRVRVHR